MWFVYRQGTRISERFVYLLRVVQLVRIEPTSVCRVEALTTVLYCHLDCLFLNSEVMTVTVAGFRQVVLLPSGDTETLLPLPLTLLLVIGGDY